MDIDTRVPLYLRRDYDDPRTHYRGARALDVIAIDGLTFRVVRWRDVDGRHWRRYTALLHDGIQVASEVDLPRRFGGHWSRALEALSREPGGILGAVNGIRATHGLEPWVAGEPAA